MCMYCIHSLTPTQRSLVFSSWCAFITNQQNACHEVVGGFCVSSIFSLYKAVGTPLIIFWEVADRSQSTFEYIETTLKQFKTTRICDVRNIYYDIQSLKASRPISRDGAHRLERESSKSLSSARRTALNGALLVAYSNKGSKKQTGQLNI